MNSRVPILVEWEQDGERQSKETHTRIVGPFGCLVVLPQNLEVDQHVHVTNQINKQSSAGVIVWRGHERPEGWEMGIELIHSQTDFWGIDL